MGAKREGPRPLTDEGTQPSSQQAAGGPTAAGGKEGAEREGQAGRATQGKTKGGKQKEQKKTNRLAAVATMVKCSGGIN